MSKFIEILKRDNSSIQDERASRIGQSAKEAQIKLILDKKAIVDALKNQKEQMLDLSTSNDMQSANAVIDLDVVQFVTSYQLIGEKLQVATMKFNVAVDNGNKLFDIDIKKLIE